MRQAEVYTNGILAGRLIETDEGKYIFQYDNTYLLDNSQKAISLSFPKRKDEYVADTIFLAYYWQLPEMTRSEQ